LRDACPFLRGTAKRIEPLFEENFARSGELGAAVSIWQHGRPVLDLNGGFRDARREQPWSPDTIVLFWSATKGLGAACLLHVLQENGIALERRSRSSGRSSRRAGRAR
jgi:CubicO group peptidase (beta-lactamase class C family)